MDTSSTVKRQRLEGAGGGAIGVDPLAETRKLGQVAKTGNSENCCPSLKSLPACVSNSIRIFGGGTCEQDLGSESVGWQKAAIASAGRRMWDSAAEGGRKSRNNRRRHCMIVVASVGCSSWTLHGVHFIVVTQQARICQGWHGKNCTEGIHLREGRTVCGRVCMRPVQYCKRRRHGWPTNDDVQPFPPKSVWAEFWAETWRFIR